MNDKELKEKLDAIEGATNCTMYVSIAAAILTFVTMYMVMAMR